MSRTPTPQQQACIESQAPMLKIEACAGSGKTSTLTMKAAANPFPSLYLAFNKVTADEAKEKFPKHVECRTTHSMAYAAFGAKMNHKLKRPQGGGYVNVAFTGGEIAKHYKLEDIGVGEADDPVILPASFIGILIRETVARFEQSADEGVSLSHVPTAELNDRCMGDVKSVKYVKNIVWKHAKKLWAERTNHASKVLATHDTYLKLFQLSKPIFKGKDILYVDEFQDTTPCVLDIVLNQSQHMKVVMVGDARQAIYAWRGAVNAMKMVDCPSLNLTKSFRYGQAVADIATTVLQRAMVIEGNASIESKVGFDNVIDRAKPYTRLFRTNSALLSCAIEEIAKGTEVSIEVDVKDFVKLLQSAKALYERKPKSVKHDKLVPYSKWEEMLADSKHDAELGRIAKVTKEGLVDRWIEVLENHINSEEPLVTFITAHKSKGREFSQVVVEGDFKSNRDEKGEWKGLSEDEQNLLYVAVTRAINVLEYNLTVEEYINHERALEIV